MMIDHDVPSEFDELTALLRQGPSDVVDAAPPASLWAAIEGGVRESSGDELAARRRRLRVATAVAAVAAVLLVGIPLGLSLRRSTPTSQETAQLAALADFTGSGEAQLEGRNLVVAVNGLRPIAGEFYELWLLDIENGQLHDLVSLGTIDTGGTFHIASAVDLSRYNYVDISIEPDDGNPAHSGDSVLRGQLA